MHARARSMCIGTWTNTLGFTRARTHGFRTLLFVSYARTHAWVSHTIISFMHVHAWVSAHYYLSCKHAHTHGFRTSLFIMYARTHAWVSHIIIYHLCTHTRMGFAHHYLSCMHAHTHGFRSCTSERPCANTGGNGDGHWPGPAIAWAQRTRGHLRRTAG